MSMVWYGMVEVCEGAPVSRGHKFNQFFVNFEICF